MDTLPQLPAKEGTEVTLQVPIPLNLNVRINIAVARRPGSTKKSVVIEALEAAFPTLEE